MAFEKDNKLSTGRPKGAKNRLTNDVRAIFHRVYDEMGDGIIDEKTGKPISGHQAMLAWAQANPTEFYRLYGKMIPASIEIPDDALENFIDNLIFEEEARRLVDGQAEVIDVGNSPQITGENGGRITDNDPPENEKPGADVSTGTGDT